MKRIVMCAVALFLVPGFLPIEQASAQPPPVGSGKAVPQVTTAADYPHEDITTSGPLTSVGIGADLSCQAAVAGDSNFEFYGPTEDPADCGTFLATGGQLYAPNFGSHDYSATSALGAYAPFTPVSQAPVAGGGATSDPYVIATDVTAGSTGLTLHETDAYATGSSQWTTNVTIKNTNSSGNALSFILYRAEDGYLANDDSGYGLYDAATGAIGEKALDSNRSLELVPVTSGSAYLETTYYNVWSAIGSKAPLPNSCDCGVYSDEGAGLSWTGSVAPGQSVTIGDITRFGFPAAPTQISLSPLSATSPIGSPVTLTAHVTDASGNPVPGVSVGFDLVSGPDLQGGFAPSGATTNASGNASATLPGFTAGTDVIDAFFDISQGQAVVSSAASITFAAQPQDLAATALKTVAKEGKIVPTTQQLATFTDPDGTGLSAGSFTARIDWGDPYFNSLPGTVVSTGGGGFAVTPSAPHMFCYTGTHQLTVTVLEPGDHESVVASSTVQVKSSATLDDNCATGGLVFKESSHACTATVVSWTGNTAVLLTAAHCWGGLFNSDGSLPPQTYIFVPGGRPQTGADAPFGAWSGTVAFVNKHFSASNDRYYDYAFIALDGICSAQQVSGQCPKTPLAQALGGGLPIRWYPAQSGTLTAINLPWTAYAQLSSPSSCSAPPKKLGSDQEGSAQQWVIVDCNMNDSVFPVSGAPWIDSSNAVDSVISSNGSECGLGCPPVIRGTYLGPEAQADFQAFTSSLS